MTSELAKSNKKSLSGKLLALSVTGMLVTTSISTAQAIPLITNNSNNNSALGSLPWVLSQVSDNNIVQFDVGINPTNINAIRIDKENITIQGNQGNTLNTEATINAINNLVNIAHTQHADDYAEFDYWLANNLGGEIGAEISDLISSQSLTQISVANQTGLSSSESGLFYSQNIDGNGLNVENLHIKMNGDSADFLGKISGGGIIGSYASSTSSIGAITNNFFDDNKVSAGDEILGGGLIGAFSYNDSSSIGKITNNLFNANHVISADMISGGGLVGSFIYQDKTSFIDSITNNIFIDNKVNASNKIQGGGLIGTFSANTTSQSTTSIGSITNNLFYNNEVSTNNNVLGGGLVGTFTYDDSSSSIGDITNNLFANNTISSQGYVYGGILGQYLIQTGDSVKWG